MSKREVWVIELYMQTAIDGSMGWEPHGQLMWHSEYSALAAANKLPVVPSKMRVVRYVPAPRKRKRKAKK